MNFLFNINVCRVCMQKNNEQASDLFKDDLVEKFKKITLLAITEEDNLPKVICSICTVRLKIAYKFIQTAHESDNNLKKFLAKISNEFKEVAQSNKHEQEKDTNVSSTEHNLTKDEMLTLMDEDETPEEKKTISALKNEKRKLKRKASPIKESIPKNFKIENKTSDKGSNVFKLQKSQNTDNDNIIKEDVLLLPSEIESENDMVEEEEDKLQDKIQEEALHNQDQHNTKKHADHDHELEDARKFTTQDTLEEDDHEAKNNQENGDENLEHIKSHDTQIINDESSETSTTELTELTLEENQFQSLEQNSSAKTVETDQDGYLREYETMLNSHDELQYHTDYDYVEENSSEETPLKTEETIGIKKMEEDQETYIIADADVVGDEDNSQPDYPNSLYPAQATGGQRNKVATKSSKDAYQNRFYCEQCNRDFSTKTNLNRHMQSHEGNKPHVCSECSKSFSQKSTLKQHERTHTGERPYVCDVCDRGFTQCKSLIFHMRRHTGEKPFQCEYCLITFRQKDALRAQDYALVGDDMSFFQPCEAQDNGGNTNFDDLAVMHLTHEYEDDLETIKTNGNIKILVDMASDESIMVDIEVYKWHHGQWINTVYSMRRSDLCASAFDPREIWYSFIMQFPEEERVCPPSKGIHILKYHVITEKLPNGKETYSCIICQKKFKAKSAFKIHMKIHTAITEPENMELVIDESTENVTTVRQTRPQSSTILHSNFLEDENIDAAIMNVAASSASEPRRAKKFQCRKCFKCFALKKSLIRHMSIHYTNVEEDTECSDCDVQFDNVDEYQEHLTEHHQFACSACPHIVFKTVHDLKMHMLEHDLEQPEQ